MRYDLIRIGEHYELWNMTIQEFMSSYDYSEYGDALKDLKELQEE